MENSSYPFVSVIMPVYNTGKILKETVDGFINQTYSNFELLLIDDGSNEETKKICDNLAEIDSRIVVIHKTNGGICNARNHGLKYAKGEYITFCDHDDIVSKYILEKEVEKCQNADIIIVGKNISDKNKNFKYGINQFFSNQQEIQENILNLLEAQLLNNIWNVLYNRRVVENIQFDETFKYGQEDYDFNYKAIMNAHSLCCIDEILYTHIVRENMSTSAKQYNQLLPDLVRTNNATYQLIKNCKIDIVNNRKYIKVQAEYIRRTILYSIKLQNSYIQFCDILSQLLFESGIHISLIDALSNKDISLFYLLKKKKYKLLYFFVNMYLKIKR